MQALAMPETEQRARMHAMRTWITEHNIYKWAASMLMDAARLRTRDRVLAPPVEEAEAPRLEMRID